MKKRWNLRNQLLIYISSLIIIISVLIASTSFKMCNQIMADQIGQSRVDVLKQIGERTSNVKESMIYVSNTLFFNSGLKQQMMEDNSNSKQSFKETFDGLIENINSAFRSTIFQFDVECMCESGLYYNTANYLNDFSKIKNELWYKELLKNPNEVLWISSTIGQVINYDSTVSAVSAVTNAAGKIVAVIIVTVNETQFSDKYENILNEDNEIFIVDGNGKIVSSNNKDMIGLKYFNLQKLSSIVGKQEYKLVTNQNGEKNNERLVSTVFDKTSMWTIIEFINTEQIFSKIDELIINIGYFLAVTVILAVLVTCFFSNRTVKPLKQFQQDLLKVKNGDIYVNSEIEGWEEIYEIKDVFNEMMVKIQELLNNIRVKEKEKHEIELDFLQAQINPHFLYNTLFSIKCMVEMRGNSQASIMLADFIELLRMVLKKEGKFIKLSREIECIEKYVTIQKYRYENKFELYYETPQECSDILVPKLILQPIVENAIFHGIEPKEAKGMIVISTRKIGNNIEIAVSDDGIGMNEEQKEKLLNKKYKHADNGWNNIGVKNVQNRIQLQYGEEYGIQIVSEVDCGTTVTLIIPCKLEEKKWD